MKSLETKSESYDYHKVFQEVQKKEKRPVAKKTKKLHLKGTLIKMVKGKHVKEYKLFDTAKLSKHKGASEKLKAEYLEQ